MPTELSHPAQSRQIVGTLLLRGVPFWQRSRGRRVARFVVLACYIYIATLLVLLSLEDRFLFPGATIARPWCEPPDYLRVRELTFDSASAFGLYDRGLLHPGMAADVVIFDPATVKCGHEVVVRDFPKGAWRIKEPAEGIFATIVNGQVLYDEGKHTGALPGRVLRNTYWHANRA